MDRGSDLRIVVTTVGAADDAAALAAWAVESGLAACAQVAEIRSWYRWRGRVEHAPEWRLDFKTTAARAADLAAALAEPGRHPYELPQIVVMRPDAVSPGDAAWVRAACAAAPEPEPEPG